MNIAKTIALAAGLAVAGAAQAQHTINLGNLNVTSTILSVDLNGATIPAGTYVAASLSTNWLAGPGDPWSNEAIWALTSGAGATGTFYVDPGIAPNSAGNGNPVTLAWNDTPFDVNYNGGDSLHFAALQTFGGSSATWGDTTLELLTSINVTPPTSSFVGVNPNTMAIDPIAASQVIWYSFDVAGGAGANPWSISSAGSTNTGGSFGDDDTELGLYNSLGQLVATNDDEDFGAGILTSLIDSTTVGALADGTYYVAAGNFNTDFAAAFGATSTSTAVGTSKVTFNFVPAPASAALLGLGGLAAIRRRR